MGGEIARSLEYSAFKSRSKMLLCLWVTTSCRFTVDPGPKGYHNSQRCLLTAHLSQQLLAWAAPIEHHRHAICGHTALKSSNLVFEVPNEPKKGKKQSQKYQPFKLQTTKKQPKKPNVSKKWWNSGAVTPPLPHCWHPITPRCRLRRWAERHWAARTASPTPGGCHVGKNTTIEEQKEDLFFVLNHDIQKKERTCPTFGF